MSDGDPERERMCLIDAHVHFHAVGRVVPTLDAAARNFRRHGATGELAGMLLLTQTASEQVFESLAAKPAAGAWSIAPAREEAITIIARHEDTALAVVCGRQLRTAEGLEVLGLGTAARFPDGLSLDKSISAVADSGALPVLPWAFGKWTGARGRMIEATLEPARAAWLFVGDNGGRLAAAGRPRLLATAERRGYRVLPGTDPFPVGSDHDRVGSFGCRTSAAPSLDAPWRALRTHLLSQGPSPQPYGHACGPFRFVKNQVGIRLR